MCTPLPCGRVTGGSVSVPLCRYIHAHFTTELGMPMVHVLLHNVTSVCHLLIIEKNVAMHYY